MRADRRPPVKDLVLVGGGHSHVQVLKMLGMAPPDGVRITVLAREAHTPYSGMLPGLVAGHYGWSDIHIDLGPLCRFAGARLIASEVTGLDLERNAVHCADHPPVRFDTLSINCGASPEQHGPSGVPVKPIGRFLPHWQELQAQVRPAARIVLVGGGAGGVELALAMRHALPDDIELRIVAAELLPGHGAGAKRLLADELVRAGIALHRSAVTASSDTGLTLDDGSTVAFDRLFWVTGVVAPDWVSESALATDARGFARVDASLRSLSHPQVFAAGDAACLEGQQRPKSGVIAVRAGPILAANLARTLAGRRLKRFRAQKRFLSLIGTGDGRAIASRSRLAVRGRWVWRWKNRIDRRFMRRFQELPDMSAPDGRAAGDDDAQTRALLEPMRCGGCGSKLAAGPLHRVLDRLPEQRHEDLVQGIGDDAAVLRGRPGPLLLTMDGFRSLVDDPYLFGRITAHHSLNDVYAMGATPTSALAIATVPLMAEAMMEEDLYQLLRGAVDVLNDDGVPLVGGHSSEGSELSLGLAVTGTAVEALLTKGGGRPGDRLLLTKPLGIGVLLAAHMRGLVPTRHVHGAIRHMDQSNREALAVLRAHRARAATDVTGFGLLGHLSEMLRAAGTGAEVRAPAVPVLDGALQSFERGAASILQAGNELALADFEVRGASLADPVVRLLADPQTAGGLLACVPATTAEQCLRSLVSAGYGAAAEIGVVSASDRIVYATDVDRGDTRT